MQAIMFPPNDGIEKADILQNRFTAYVISHIVFFHGFRGLLYTFSYSLFRSQPA